MTFPMLCTRSGSPLDDETQQGAADHAVEINPVNHTRPMVALPPQRIALLTSRYWGAAQRRLGVAFLDRATCRCRGADLGAHECLVRRRRRYPVRLLAEPA